MDSGGNEPAKRSWWRRWGWTIPVGLALITGALSMIDLLWTAAGADRTRQMDAAQKTFTIVVGLGGAVTLAVLIHRQVVTAAEHKRQLEDQAKRFEVAEHNRLDAERRFEHAERVAAENLAHARAVAAATQADAIQKRAQELFVKAVDQLGHDKAAVRVGALHALDDLGQEHPKRRRAVMDVWCAYLRMPPPPDDVKETSKRKEKPKTAKTEAKPAVAVWPAEELQVRATAQRLIADHLRDPREPDSEEPEPERFWGVMDIDLSGAHLHDSEFLYCRFGTALFSGAEFAGVAWFGKAEFAGGARFSEARFGGGTRFEMVKFTSHAKFDGVEFVGDTRFTRAKFAGDAEFGETKFAGDAEFGEAEFAWTAWFSGAEFAGSVWFTKARFGRGAWFTRAKFAGGTGFSETEFAGGAEFGEAEFTGSVWFTRAKFAEDAGFNKAEFAGAAIFGGAEFAAPHKVNLAGRFHLAFVHLLPPGWRAAPRDGKPGRVLEWDLAFLPALLASEADGS
ncbi:pentapeptide repeat-containing protein [Phytomonospora sp. NPDC050363]|uniref:pentapeptide repeat-containing protein n=1 Tax=Phytomonospora sp. NPDC050363 TaxID=3155642 RepID=UPI0033E54490